MIYLDNAATTAIDPLVLAKMQPFLTEAYGNPGAIYGLGRQAAEAVSEARKQTASFIGAEPEQICFTSGGSEANSLAVRSPARYLRRTQRQRILISATEHDSVTCAAEALAGIGAGFSVGYLSPEQNGSVPPNSLKHMKKADGFGLVSVMYVNNETGAVNPVQELAAEAHRIGALFHTDCVQAAACLPLDVDKLRCDFLSLSSHKLHGPKGVGALYIRNAEKLDLQPLICGGASQERGLRGGTENVAGIVGFGEACRLMAQRREEETRRCEEIKQGFYIALSTHLDRLCRSRSRNISDLLTVNGPSVSSPSRILNLCFHGIDAETLLLMLDARFVCISAGSACRSHEQEPSRVLMSMGVSAEDARNSVRVSFSGMNTREEAVEAAGLISECIAALLR